MNEFDVEVLEVGAVDARTYATRTRERGSFDHNNAVSPSNGVGTTLNPGETKIMPIRLANGGAATLPVDIHLQLGS